MDINDLRSARHRAVASSPSSASSCWAWSRRNARSGFDEAGADCRSHDERRQTESTAMSDFTTDFWSCLRRRSSRCVSIARPALRAAVDRARASKVVPRQPTTPPATSGTKTCAEIQQPAAALVDVAVLHHDRVRRSATCVLYPGLGSFAGRARLEHARRSTTPSRPRPTQALAPLYAQFTAHDARGAGAATRRRWRSASGCS